MAGLATQRFLATRRAENPILGIFVEQISFYGPSIAQVTIYVTRTRKGASNECVRMEERKENSDSEDLNIHTACPAGRALIALAVLCVDRAPCLVATRKPQMM